MSPVRFRDPLPDVRDHLRALLEGRTEPEALGVTVSTLDLPGDDVDRPLPYVRVTADDVVRSSRASADANLRFLIYHRDAGLGQDLAFLIEALLLGTASATVRAYTAGPTGPVEETDPDLGIPFSALTTTARLRPHSIERANPL